VKSSTKTSSRRVQRLACFLTVALGAPLAAPSLASADPIGDKRAQAQALADQISVLGSQEAGLSEHYDAAILAEQRAGTQVDVAAKQEAEAQAAVNQAGDSLRSDAIAAYTRGGNTGQGMGGGANLVDAQSSLLRVEYARTLATSQADHRDQYRLTQGQAATKKAQLDAARRAAAEQAATADSARRAVAGSATQLQATYKQVQGEMVTLVAQAEAAKQAEQARAAQAAEQARQQAAQRQVADAQALTAQASTAQVRSAASAGVGTSPGDGPATQTTPPAPMASPSMPDRQSAPAPAPARAPAPTGSGGGAAVAAAMTKLGDPYVWAAAGPNAFDCSGLTMWAWAQAGVSLPHYSGAQYSSTTHISMSELQPGDLVFFSDTGAHEAMYIGGGQIIEAPYTGASVRIEPLYSQFVLASRPS